MRAPFDLFAAFHAELTPQMRLPACAGAYSKIKLLRVGYTKAYEEAIKNYEGHTIEPNLRILEAIGLQEVPRSLPTGSIFVSFKFTLQKPLIIGGDEGLYPKDNPIAKDKVFKIPYIPSSSWKGNLRWVTTKLLADQIREGRFSANKGSMFEERAKLVRLFGNEKDNVSEFLCKIIAQVVHQKEDSDTIQKIEDEFQDFLYKKDYLTRDIEGRRGRLNLYSTFFGCLSLDIINPHDRKTRTGKVPIQFEVIPVSEGKGLFKLLYFPFDLIGKSHLIREIPEDWELILKSLKEMFIAYGFSAKKTSGYGVAYEKLEDGILIANNVKTESFSNFTQMKDRIGEIERLWSG